MLMERAQELFTLIVLPLALIPIVGLAIWAGVCLIGDFSWRQGLVIAVLFCSLYLLHEIQMGKQKVPLRPFFVWVKPNWYELLSDYGLVKSPEEFDRIYQQSAKVPSYEFDVFRSGIRFTFLNRELVYWNGREQFTRRADLVFPLDEIKIDSPHGRRRQIEDPEERKASGQFSPRIYMKERGGFYQLGIQVETDWWKQIKSAGHIRDAVAATKASDDYEIGMTDLTLATIPPEEFSFLYECNPDYYWKHFDQIQKRLNATRDKLGWKEDEIFRRLQDETFRRQPTRLEHKYFVVEHYDV